MNHRDPAAAGEERHPGAAAMREGLPRMWGPLLARHGTPTAIQLAAFGPLLAGRDVLLCAPTASGKTEGYLAPLAERHVPPGLADTAAARLLLISPTRALANDLYRRLREPLAQARVPFGRWTGEHHDQGRMHAVTVLTPEALDARLSRSPAFLTEVRAVVIDEAHVLDGSARGDQLRVLLERLRVGEPTGGTRAHPIQVAGASATVPDPEAVARRYLRDPVVVQAGDRRRIRARIEVDVSPVRLTALLSEQTAQGFRKVLAFCNSREDVETTARLLRGRPPFGEVVLAHHGSLSRAARLSAEARFLSAPAAICVATSTLELGIDIGDVDLVLLKGVPPDLSALIQRIGRGGRRVAQSHVLATVASDFEASMLHTMLDAYAAGTWFSTPYAFRPGVLVQQALSILHARTSRTVDAAALHRRLPPDLQAEWALPRIEAVLAHTATQGWLGSRAPDGRYGLGVLGERAWARGQLHANLAERKEVAIHDALTGDTLGHVTRVDAEAVGLGGRGRRSLHQDGERVVVTPDDTAELARFGGGASTPVSAALATAWLRGAGIPCPCRAKVLGKNVLFHGLGTAGGMLLAFALKRSGYKIDHKSRLAVILDGEWPESWPTAAAARTALGHLHRGLGRKLQMGAFHPMLPEDERLAAVGALAELPILEAFLRVGVPPEVQVDDEELWEDAAYA